nr:uncharacterized protein LOC103420263 isoform X3 [Malus domestica]
MEAAVALGHTPTCGGPGPVRLSWVGPLCHPGKAAPVTPLRCLSRPSPLLPSTSALWPPPASLASMPLASASFSFKPRDSSSCIMTQFKALWRI